MTTFASASMITAGDDRSAAVLLSREFELERSVDEIESATFRATAHGVYEARINGRPTSEALLSPGWSAYEWRLEVCEEKVTSLLRARNTIEILLGNGWWRGDLGFQGADISYGDTIGCVAELRITFSDGHIQVVGTDAGWAARRSDVVENNLYDGQRIDARLRTARHSLPVREIDFDASRLVPRASPPVTRQEVLAPVEIFKSPAGNTLVDFGQNLVGWVRLRARGPAGTEITVRHAEVLADGELATMPLRSARATDTFVLSGGEDEFEPTLTFHGFRYVEVSGYPREVEPADLDAVVVHSDVARIGDFNCSSDLVNRLVENAIWSQKGNFLSVPTDCPQRDERLGWTGDIAVYAETACVQFNVADFLHGWLLDLAEETRHNPHRAVPSIVPDVLKHGPPLPAEGFLAGSEGPTAVWGDAAVWVPWAIWQAYGDRERLRAHYPGMVLHLESVLSRLSPNGLWDTGFQWGDWLDPDAPPEEPYRAKADPGVVATACLVRSASLAAAAADELGYHDDARRWADLAAKTKAAFVAHYVTVGGWIYSDCATVYALAIHFDILDGGLRQKAGDRLAEIVRESGHAVTTGFAGTPYVTWALSATGHVTDAYHLLLRTECPSWLYPVTMGATTVWERWDSLLPTGAINSSEMTSFNHYALGAIVDWLYKVVAGLRPAQPGYARLRIEPMPGPGLHWARAALRTPYGRVESGWERRGGEIHVRVEVPPSVTADVVLLDGSRAQVGAGRHEFVYQEGAAAIPDVA